MTVQDILNMEIPIEFGTDDEGEFTPSMDSVVDNIDNTEFAFGATKFVIFINEKEVVKIPFNGTFWYDYNEDDETETLRFWDFHTKDYCAVEADIYDEAEEEGLEEFFASTKYIGQSINGKPIYISERVIPFNDNNEEVKEKTNSYTKENLETADTLRDEFRTRLSSEWIARAIEYYGFDRVLELLDFIDMENICDLHSNNIGFRINGAPVIFDYSSYWEG